jgi:putative RecB family exonuclease
MPVYSHSRLETYQNCSLKYKFQYIDRLQKEEKGAEAFLGSRVHEALEKLYRDLLNGKQNTREELLDFYNRQWEQHWDENRIKIVRQEYTSEHYYKAGWLCVDGYYTRYHPFDEDTTLGVEVRVDFNLGHDNRYRMLGFIDRLARAKDGIWEIHDYKTSSSLPSQAEVDDKPQLALYQIGVQQKWPQIQDVRLVWHYLRFDTALSTLWSTSRLQELQQSTKQAIDQIEAAREYLPRESRLCDWCDFQDRCPKRKHLFETSALAPKAFRADEGVQLVDRYASLKNQEREIRELLDEVRERLIAYARRKEVEVISGTEELAAVRFQEKFKFPESGGDRKKFLVDLLRQAGKWDEISILSIQKLDRILRNEEWDAELVEQIKELVTLEEECKVNLRRKNQEK